MRLVLGPGAGRLPLLLLVRLAGELGLADADRARDAVRRRGSAAAGPLFRPDRFGLLALVFGNFFWHFLEFPLTTDSSAWYAGTSLFLLLVLAALAVFGFRIALAGRPAFSGARLDD